MSIGRFIWLERIKHRFAQIMRYDNIGPQKELSEDIFLDDPHKLFDVEKLVSIYGGERISCSVELLGGCAVHAGDRERLPGNGAGVSRAKSRNRRRGV